MQARLLQGCRLATAASRACNRGPLLHALSGLNAAQPSQRAVSTRAERRGGGGGGGGRRERGAGGREREAANPWGDDWDLGTSGSSGSASSGWLGSSEEPGRRGGADAPWSSGGGGRGGGGRGERSFGDRRGGYERREGGRGGSSRGGGGGRFGQSGGAERWSGGGGGRRDGRGERGQEWQAQGRERGGGGRGEFRSPAPSRRSGWDDDLAEEEEEGGWQERQEGEGRWQGRSGRGGREERGRWDERGGREERGFDRSGASREERGGGGGGLREAWVGDALYGVSPVLAALQAGRRTVHALYLQEGMDLAKRKDKGAIQAARRAAEQLGVDVKYASKHDLNMMADNRPHQGVMLDCSALEFEALNAMPDPHAAAGAPGSESSNGSSGGAATGRLPVWLCLDEVMDPQNFGAALRCALFLGVDGVLTCHRNSAPLSPVVSKASAGAMELMAVHSTKSLPSTLADAAARGWQVLGAAAEPGAHSAASFVLQKPAILVMGNEGYGLRGSVRRLCDGVLQIDGGAAGSPGAGFVDSLNVSVATGILLHRLLTAQEGMADGGAAAPRSAAAAEAAAELRAPLGQAAGTASAE